LWVGDAGGVGYMLVGKDEERSPRRSTEGLKDNVRMILKMQRRLVQVGETESPWWISRVADIELYQWNQNQEVR
jgi:hypothetical protein